MDIQTKEKFFTVWLNLFIYLKLFHWCNTQLEVKNYN